MCEFIDPHAIVPSGHVINVSMSLIPITPPPQVQMIVEKVTFLPNFFYDPFWNEHPRVWRYYEEVPGGLSWRLGALQHK